MASKDSTLGPANPQGTDFTIGWPCNVSEYANREDWLIRGRTRGIGASDTAGIFGVGYANQSPLSVWSSKVNVGPIDEDENERLWIGKLIEPSLRAIFQRKTGNPCMACGDFTIYSHEKFPWLCCTLDGAALHPDFGPVPLELKNVDSFQGKEWRDGDAPLKYQLQLQHQLAVTGASHGFLMGLIGGNKPEIRVIERNERFIEVMLAKLEEFWGYVQRREMPPVDAFPVHDYSATNKFLGKLFPDDSGESIALPPFADEWAVQIYEAKEAIKAAEAKKDEAEARIKAEMKNATLGLLPDGGEFTWRKQNRKSFVVEATSFRVLRFKPFK